MMESILALLLIVFGEQKEVKIKKCIVGHYSFAILEHFVCKELSPPNADFVLIGVGKKIGKPMMRIYFGNAPQFPIYHWPRKPEKIENENRSMIRYLPSDSEGKMEGLLSFEGLLAAENLPSPFSKIHYFANNLNRKKSMEVSLIVDSIEIVTPVLVNMKQAWRLSVQPGNIQ